MLALRKANKKNRAAFKFHDGGARSFEEAVRQLVREFFRRDAAGRVGGMTGKKDEPDKKALDEKVALFFSTDGLGKLSKKDRERGHRSVPEMRFFAVQVASRFYSRTLRREQWIDDAGAWARVLAELSRRAALAEAATASGDVVASDGAGDGADDSAGADPATDKLTDAERTALENVRKQTEESNEVDGILARLDASGALRGDLKMVARLCDPLAQAEVPQFVRNVVNGLYPLRYDEVYMVKTGVVELDLLFSESIGPLEQVETMPRAYGPLPEPCKETTMHTHTPPPQSTHTHTRAQTRARTRTHRSETAPTPLAYLSLSLVFPNRPTRPTQSGLGVLDEHPGGKTQLAPPLQLPVPARR